MCKFTSSKQPCVLVRLTHWHHVAGIGQAGPLTLLIALIQYTAPHAFLANATGLAFSARAIGGAFGSAVVNVIINNKLEKTLAPKVAAAAIGAGLPSSSVPALMAGMASGSPTLLAAVPGINPTILGAAFDTSHHVYAAAYRLGWASIIPFVVLALVAVICTKGVSELMTEKVEATVEHVHLVEEKGAWVIHVTGDDEALGVCGKFFQTGVCLDYTFSISNLT